MKEKKNSRIEITELFMAKAGNDWNRCYHGTIKREHDVNGNPVVYCKIKIGNGYIYATAPNQWELGKKLDEMVLLILDYNLHEKSGNGSLVNLN